MVTRVGPGRDTQSIYREYCNIRGHYPDIASRIDRTSGMISRRMVRAIEQGTFERTGELMNMEHGILESFGLVGDEVDRAVHFARASGAYGAKMTGAGGNGAVIALVDEDAVEEVRQSWREQDWKVLKAIL